MPKRKVICLSSDLIIILILTRLTHICVKHNNWTQTGRLLIGLCFGSGTCGKLCVITGVSQWVKSNYNLFFVSLRWEEAAVLTPTPPCCKI